VDATHIGGADETDCEESMLPVTHDIHSLIRFENVSVGFEIAGVYWFEVASYMPSVARSKHGWRVIPVVVFRG